MEQALRDAKLSPKDIDEVVLVGGSTRVPKVQDFVRQQFNGKEPHKGVNPDEVVSVGAAIQGGIIGGEVKEMVLLDVTPLSLGIETEGGIMTVLIERNTTIPVEKKEIFSTAADNQTAVTVSVFQGERKMARDNRLLGQFNLDGIPPAPRGVPQIEVNFDIDVNGILKVSARDIASGKEQSVRIEKSSGLSETDIDRMKKDAESHAEEDLRKRKLAEARNHAARLVYETEKVMKEHADKLDAASNSAIESSIERVNKATAGDDAGAIESAVKDLEQAAHALSKHMYEAAAKAGGGERRGGTAAGRQRPHRRRASFGPSTGDNVIDAEFEKDGVIDGIPIREADRQRAGGAAARPGNRRAERPSAVARPCTCSRPSWTRTRGSCGR